MAIIAAAAVLAVSPAAMAQTTNQAAGGAGAGARGAGRGGFGGRTNTMTVESLDKALTLTDAEKPKVKTALEQYNKAREEAMQADQSERRTKMATVRTDFNKKMKEILTPEQYTKYEAMSGRGGRGGRNRGGAGGGGGAGGAGGGGQ